MVKSDRSLVTSVTLVGECDRQNVIKNVEHDSKRLVSVFFIYFRHDTPLTVSEVSVSCVSITVLPNEVLNFGSYDYCSGSLGLIQCGVSSE
jgi:hypothetical protein